MLGRTFSIFVALFAVVAFILGLFDRPPFEHHDSLLANHRNLSAIVATCTEKNIGKHVSGLLQATKRGIESVNGGTNMLKLGASNYHEKGNLESLALGLYFDDPAQHDQPRYAVGWAVESDSFENIQDIIPQVQSFSGLKATIRAVRIEQRSDVLKAKIPWRTALQPMIAPLLHWKRAFKEYRNGPWSTRSGEYGPISLEVYVQNPEGEPSYMDYIVLMGDTSRIWQDVYPVMPVTAESAREEEPPEPVAEPSVEGRLVSPQVEAVSDVFVDTPGVGIAESADCPGEQETYNHIEENELL